jgi:uncharacterized protein (TIGR00661 family)
LINGNNFNTKLSTPRILIAPLDWGLGHATRCIPIIKELINENCEVLIATDSSLKFLLKKEFPQCVFVPIIGYKIKYSRNGKRLYSKLLFQLPKIIFSVWKENRWLKKIINEYKIDAVISDNRFGLYNKRILCVYITHQLYIKAGNRFSEKLAQEIHNYFIRKYNICWVPDLEENGLAGKLSHPKNKPSNVAYIGPLSRFEKLNTINIKYELLISLSGPEPQRTIFEKVILTQLATFKSNILLVRGLPYENEKIEPPGNSVEIVNHLSAQELNIAFQQSEIIISRSGYSTIMDLVKLGKNAILVPTPGQGEQEYLAEYLMKKSFFYSIPQNNFYLNRAIAEAKNFRFIKKVFAENNYKKIMREFILLLKK